MTFENGVRLEELAAEIAALLEERDPLAGVTDDAAITTRLETLHRAGRNGRWGRIRQIAEQYRHLVPGKMVAGSGNGPQCARRTEKTVAGSKEAPKCSREIGKGVREASGEANRGWTGMETGTNPYLIGRLLAQAYPERVAKARAEGPGRFQLATGELAAVDPGDPLAACDWLAVASLSVRPGGVGRIFLAAPVNPEDLPELMRTRDRVVWDSKAGATLAQRERRIGGLLVDARPLSEGVR